MKVHKQLKGLFSSKLYCTKETDSVLDDALLLCKKHSKRTRQSASRVKNNELFGTVIISDYQRKGRGQRSKAWQAPPKTALLMACIFCKDTLLRYNKDLAKPEQLTLCSASAVAQTITGLLQEKGQTQQITEVSIKWPNDVLIHNCKVAGILTEVRKDKILVGLGINLVYWPIWHAVQSAHRQGEQKKNDNTTSPQRQVLVQSAVESLIQPQSQNKPKLQEIFIEQNAQSSLAPTALDCYNIMLNSEELYAKFAAIYEQTIMQDFDKTLVWVNDHLWLRGQEVHYYTNENPMHIARGIVTKINADSSLQLQASKDANYNLYSGGIRK